MGYRRDTGEQDIEDLTTSFGYWVRRKRLALDLTQSALAHRVGCARITIKKIERDERRPSRLMAERLADGLTIPRDQREAFILSGLGERRVDLLPLPSEPSSPSPPHEIIDRMESMIPINVTEGFVGRERELGLLLERLRLARGGKGQVVFIAGEAGRGKSALMTELALKAMDVYPEALVAGGNCNAYAGMGDPYLPFCDVMALLTGDLETRWASAVYSREQVSRLLAFAQQATGILIESGPDLLGSIVPAEELKKRMSAAAPHLANRIPKPDAWRQSHLHEQLTRVLSAVADRRLLLLLLDDMQWVDPASAQMLFHVGRRLEGKNILIVGAYRPSEIQEGRADAIERGRSSHPLEPILNEFHHRFGDIEINLEQFNVREDRRFVDALIDREPNELDESFRRSLFWRTKGHPLFTVELLRAMKAHGDLEPDLSGSLVARGILDWETLPARVEAVITQRLSQLDKHLREILATASVEGETFTVSIIAGLLNLKEKDLLRTLSQELQVRYRLVKEANEVVIAGKRFARYQFNHALFQQYLYAGLSQGERRLLHEEIAARLEAISSGKTGTLSAQLAHHYAETGKADKAVLYLLQAGDRARTLYAHREAVEHYQRAYAFLKEQNNLEGMARTLMKIGLTHHIAFDFERANQAYAQGSALWQRSEVGFSPASQPLRMIWRDPPSLDPTMGGWNLTHPILTQLLSGLVAHGPEMEVVPDVARSWEILDGGRKFLFHLRDDVYWTDGVPVTASDFEFSYKRALDPETKAPVAAELLYSICGAQAYHQGETVDSDNVGVRALDELTLEFDLEEPTTYFLQDLSYYVLLPVPKHIVNVHDDKWTEPGRFVSNGPFRLTAWERGGSMILERNPRYHGSFSGNIEQVILTLVDNPLKALDLYSAGEIDVINNWFFPAVELDSLRRQYPDEYLIRPKYGTIYLVINPMVEPFTDRRVRQALGMATDRQAMVEIVTRGYEIPGLGGFVPSGMPGYSPDIGLPFDIPGARKLLAEAGYPGGQGFPELRFYGSPSRWREAEFLCQNWKEHLGITTELLISDHTTPEMVEGVDRPLIIGGWWADYADPDNFLRVDVRVDLPTWRDSRYENLLEAVRVTTDQSDRLRLFQEADKVLMDEAVILPLCYTEMHMLLKPWVKNFPTTAIKNPGFWKDVILQMD